MFSLNHLREQVQDIARPYHFRCAFESGCFGGLDVNKVTATMKSSSLPGVTVAPVPINYFGMTYKIAGTPTYNDLNCQFLIDAEYSILTSWKEVLDKIYYYNESQGPMWSSPDAYMGNMNLFQLNTQREPVSKYKLSMAFLSGISDIAYAQESTNAHLTFDATITYSYYLKIG